jgi:hypothetical protein
VFQKFDRGQPNTTTTTTTTTITTTSTEHAASNNCRSKPGKTESGAKTESTDANTDAKTGGR